MNGLVMRVGPVIARSISTKIYATKGVAIFDTSLVAQRV
jgi:hypothetical protein